MPRIRCHYMDCAFIDDGFCSAAAVELDPDTGCMTYSPSTEETSEEKWDEEEDEMEEWEEVDEDEEEGDDLWLEDEEEEY